MRGEATDIEVQVEEDTLYIENNSLIELDPEELEQLPPPPDYTAALQQSLDEHGQRHNRAIQETQGKRDQQRDRLRGVDADTVTTNAWILAFRYSREGRQREHLSAALAWLNLHPGLVPAEDFSHVVCVLGFDLPIDMAQDGIGQLELTNGYSNGYSTGHAIVAITRSSPSRRKVLTRAGNRAVRKTEAAARAMELIALHPGKLPPVPAPDASRAIADEAFAELDELLR